MEFSVTHRSTAPDRVGEMALDSEGATLQRHEARSMLLDLFRMLPLGSPLTGFPLHLRSIAETAPTWRRKSLLAFITDDGARVEREGCDVLREGVEKSWLEMQTLDLVTWNGFRDDIITLTPPAPTPTNTSEIFGSLDSIFADKLVINTDISADPCAPSWALTMPAPRSRPKVVVGQGLKVHKRAVLGDQSSRNAVRFGRLNDPMNAAIKTRTQIIDFSLSPSGARAASERLREIIEHSNNVMEVDDDLPGWQADDAEVEALLNSFDKVDLAHAVPAEKRAPAVGAGHAHAHTLSKLMQSLGEPKKYQVRSEGTLASATIRPPQAHRQQLPMREASLVKSASTKTALVKPPGPSLHYAYGKTNVYYHPGMTIEQAAEALTTKLLHCLNVLAKLPGCDGLEGAVVVHVEHALERLRYLRRGRRV